MFAHGKNSVSQKDDHSAVEMEEKKVVPGKASSVSADNSDSAAMRGDGDDAASPPEAQGEEGHRTTSVKGLISDAASNTGTHGVPNIMRTKSLARRIFWTIVVLAGLGEAICLLFRTFSIDVSQNYWKCASF